MKKFKIILIILAVIVAIPIVIVVVILGLIFLFMADKNNYHKEQDIYFEKEEYYFCGQMVSYKLLGGVTYLIEIDVDSVLFIKNDISSENDFVGLYSEKQKKILFNADLTIDENTDKNAVSEGLPYVRVKSSNRTVEYIINKETTVYGMLDVSNFYKRGLKKKETEDMIRF